MSSAVHWHNGYPTAYLRSFQRGGMMATSYDISATHGYGPVGCVLGMFAGDLSHVTARKLWNALMDSASRDWQYMVDARDDTEREYHRRRWLDQKAGADYIDLIFPNEGGE